MQQNNMYEWQGGATGSKGGRNLKYNGEVNLELKEGPLFHAHRRNGGRWSGNRCQHI